MIATVRSTPHLLEAFVKVSVLLILITLAACGTDRAELQQGIQHYGLYAVDDEGLRRLDGNAEWERRTWSERANLESDAEFVVFSPQFVNSEAPFDQSVQLVRVAKVRNEVHSDGRIVPIKEVRYEAPDIPAYEVLLDFGPVRDRPDALRVVPREPLSSGLYALQVITPQGTRRARFGVAWPEVDKTVYARQFCVDRVEGAKQRYYDCATEPGGAGLSVHLVAPERTGNGDSKRLVVQGVVVNVSDKRRNVPKLVAVISGDGQEGVRRWMIDVPAETLEPGESASFKSEVPNPPASKLRLNVNFMPYPME